MKEILIRLFIIKLQVIVILIRIQKISNLHLLKVTYFNGWAG